MSKAKAPSKMLSVSGLEVHFSTETGLVKAVDGIDFQLARGETLGVVGESGSGKSVTALALMRLVPPPGRITAGSIEFLSPEKPVPVNLLALPEKQMRTYRGRRIAMIFQEPMTSLNPVMRCGEQVAEVLKLHTKQPATLVRDEVMAWFGRVQLDDPQRIYNAYPHQLSGGQKQRVMIAMAMSSRPDILIADEPTTALDVTVQHAILQLIRELTQAYGTAVIFITHDLGVIARIADRSLVMHQGKVVESGPVGKIFTDPQHPYTRGLLACRPPLDHRLQRLPVISDFWSGAEQAEAETQSATIFEPQRITTEDSRKRLAQLLEQPPVLQVDDLQTWFPMRHNFWGRPGAYVKAVDGVSFEVYPGETLGLVGESGCGKTTLGRSILRLVEPIGGRIVYSGLDVTSADEAGLRELRKEMQIIFQDPYASLNPRMTVGAALAEPMQVHGIGSSGAERKERVLALMDQVGLATEHYYRYPHEFSGGQRQRICIARALAVEPDFIVCDESVSALDVSVQAQILNLLQSLRETRGLTYIFISHDLSVVRFMSDRILVMHQGKIVEQGPSDEIYYQPRHAYTQRLIEAIPRV